MHCIAGRERKRDWNKKTHQHCLSHPKDLIFLALGVSGKQSSGVMTIFSACLIFLIQFLPVHSKVFLSSVKFSFQRFYWFYVEVTGVGWLQYWTAIDVRQHRLVLQTEERSLALGSLNYIGKITALITAIEYVCCCKDDSDNYVKMSLKSFCKILFSSFYSAKHEIEIRKWSMFFHIFSYCGSLSWNFYSDCTNDNL